MKKHTYSVLDSVVHRGFFVGLLASVLSGCGGPGVSTGEQSEPSEAVSSEEGAATVLARVTAADGTEYSFLDSRSGDLTLAVGANHEIDISSLLHQHPTLSELYESVAGRAAPDSLRAADERLAVERSKVALEPNLEAPELVPEFDAGERASSSPQAGDIGRSAQALTAGEFQNLYCPSGWDFLYCWPDTGGNPWVQRTSWYLLGAMSATNCSTRFRYRYYDDGDWYTLVDRTATPGQHWYYYQYGSTRSRRFEVLDNAGCGVRFAVYGLL
jgi:hypothetical protein